ncbi:MAG: GspE/PulE family protein [Phycisphaerales bacterium]|jgi:type IV pilus assembly protein PilB
MEKKNPVISYLVDQKILDEETLARVVDQHRTTGESLASILEHEDLLSEDQLTDYVAKANKIDFVNIAPEMIDPIVAHLVSYELASTYTLIPIDRKDDRLVVAMSSPWNLTVQDQVERKTGYTVVPVAAAPSAIRQAIHYHFNVQNETKQTIVSMQLNERNARRSEPEETEQPQVSTPTAPIVGLVSSIINSAIDSRASDIHIEPQEAEVRVRYRIDGLLDPAVKVPLSAQRELTSHIKIMADMDISERRMPQDGHLKTRRDGREYDLRVSSLPGIAGEKIVIRILSKDVDQWSFDEIVKAPDDNSKLRSIVSNPYGMLLLAGPTGCGKTTTLYGILQLLNTPERNIVTVEDPVEYSLNGITQVQVRPSAGRTFASALRSIVRQDPDVILIGEIRDIETADIAISAALTGHMVLSTIHTNDSIGAVSRLMNLGIPSYLIASALLGTATQRLIRLLCTRCRQLSEPSQQELRCLLGKSDPPETLKYYRSKGCENCHQAGYRERKSIYEIVCISSEIRKLIANGSNDEQIRQQAIEEKTKFLHQSAVNEVLSGVTTLEEVTRVVDMRID